MSHIMQSNKNKRYRGHCYRLSVFIVRITDRTDKCKKVFWLQIKINFWFRFSHSLVLLFLFSFAFYCSIFLAKNVSLLSLVTLNFKQKSNIVLELFPVSSVTNIIKFVSKWALNDLCNRGYNAKIISPMY